MRTLAITRNTTLDGSIEMLGDWFDPTVENCDDVHARTAKEHATNDATLLGRRTFEHLRGFWPKQTDDTTGVTDQPNRIQKYDVSSTLTDPGWDKCTIKRAARALPATLEVPQ